ncbi:MAG: choice-of-anchor D domain-containing protein [bacterium]|nr:choice-of-anchor D domain-containing protein [bacterium]
MITRLFCACIALVAIATSIHAQDVVVSEYFQSNPQAAEWTELLVVGDNVNMVGYHVSDYNGGQLVRQGGVTFRDVPVWRHVRAGTIIVIYHLDVPGGTQPDTSAADGFLELSRNDGRFFDQFGANGLNINQESDFVVVLAPDENHIHGLGHAATPGPGYTNAPTPKVQCDSGILGNDRSIGVVGRSLKAYDARISRDSTAITPVGTKGLPNIMDAPRSLAGRRNVNYWFWRETREPQWSAAPSMTLVSQTASAHVISWTPLVDAYSQDGTTGYMILRDTLNFSTLPANGVVDGSIYTVGSRIGSALILAIRPTSAGAQYGDSLNLMCGQNYTYRVYGYRYVADQRIPLAQQADTTARGRQYTELKFAQSAVVTKANPTKPVIAASRTQICPGDTASLTTTSAGPRYEWLVNGQPVPVGGSTKIVVFEIGTYKLRVVADGGCFAESDPITIAALPASTIDIAPTGTQTICTGDSLVIRALTPAASYQWLKEGQLIAGETGNTFVARQAGDYFVRSQTAQGCPATSAIVRVRIPNITYSFSNASLDFGVLGSCASSTSGTIDVVNDGAEPLTISNVTFSAGFSLVSPAPGFALAPGARQTLRILFSPSTTGVTNGTATFTALPCAVKRTLPLTGNRTQALASINKAAVDFGVFAACDITPTIRPDSTFRITNDGTSNITVTAPIVSPPFYLIGANISETITPGNGVDYRVQYSPLGPERDSSIVAQIQFPYSSLACNDTLRATLKAAAYRPQLAIDVRTIDVGALLSCATSVDTFVNVTNNSFVDATFESSSNPSIVVPDAPLTIDAGISRSVRVLFTAPTTPGPFSVTTNIRVLTCGDLQPLTITGTVVDPQASFSQTVFDFGTINSCDTNRSRTQPMPLYMRNAPATVSSVDLSPPFSTTLGPGVAFSDSVNVIISFTPTTFGDFSDTLVVVLAPCGDTVKLVLFGSGEDPSVRTTMSNMDFGILTPGQTVTERVVVVNVGTTPTTVQPLANVVAPFSIVSSTPTLPASLAPGDSAVVLVQYTHIGAGRDDRISIVMRTIGACPSTTTIAIIGRTQAGGVITGVVLAMPLNHTARAGDNVAIPIALTSPTALDSANVLAMHIVLSFDPTLLRALTITDLTTLGITGTVSETVPGIAIIDLISAQPIKASTPFIALNGKTYLGRSSQTALRVDSVTAKGLVITGQDGQLTLSGSCAADALQIQLGAPMSLKATYDASSDIVIEFTTLTDDPVVITVVDMRGIERIVPIDGTVRPGSYRLTVDAGQLQAGPYIVSMRHGLHVRTAKLMIAP